MTTTAPPAPPHSPSRVATVGVIAGTTSGLFGVGGGIVMVPALGTLARFPHKLATGTSLTAIVPISIAAALGYASAGEVDLTVGALVAGGAVVGALLGTRFLRSVQAPMLQFGFAALMALTALRLMAGGESDGAGRTAISVGTVVGLLVLGLSSGLLAGLFGVGGGIIIVPVLTLLFDVPLVLAKGTSLAVIIPTAIIGTLRNRSAGLTAVRPGLLVGVTGAVTAVLASQVSLGLDPTVSSILFAVLLLLVAARLGRVAWHELRSAAVPHDGTGAGGPGRSATEGH